MQERRDPQAITEQRIQRWLIDQIAEELGLEPNEIAIDEPFESFGLSSRAAVSLSGDLEEWLGRRLQPTLVWEHPTILSLARYLAEGSGPGEESQPPEAPLPAHHTAAAQEPAADHRFSVADHRFPVAIIGIGCRFPGAEGPQAFWQMLRDGVDAIRPVPSGRWDVDAYYDPDPQAPGKINTRWGGFLDRVDEFDAHFFGISPREATRTDPQQRLLLETAWQALEDAGLPAERLAGSRTGVYVGISGNEYSHLQLRHPEQIDAYAGTGNALSIAANRVSFCFDLHGPSVAIDTACSSSLVAVHLACSSLWNGEADLALAGGVNLVLTPAVTINFTKANAMAADGRCKTFDARADGYVRSEGVGMMVLKPFSQAVADGDPIYALILGSAVNQDGRSNGLMAPNPQAQQAVIQEACRRAGISPAQIRYVEAHGTGTFLGDPIEAQALGAVLRQGRPAGQPCRIGSVKTNIGHTEAAAGVAGLIKTALALKHQQLPPSLHYGSPNPHIPFDELGLQVQTELATWPEGPGPALAGVSSFGFGGTNAHIILQEYAPTQPVETPGEAQEKTGLLAISARSTQALRDHAQAYHDFLIQEDSQAGVHLSDALFTAARRRSHHQHRLAITGSSREEFAQGLRAYLDGRPLPGTSSGQAQAFSRPVFVFPGQGSQWAGMARELLQSEPVFRDTLQDIAAELQHYVDWSLLDVLLAEGDDNRLEDVDVVQPVLFAVQVGLSALWRSWGIEPGAVAGHSMGEAAAAYAAGVLSLPQAVQVICQRSRLLKRTSGEGAMAAVRLSLDEARQALAGREDRLCIAVSNSPGSTVISGEREALAELVERLEAQGVQCRYVKVDVAAHSPQVEPLVPELVAALGDLQPQAGSIPFYSTVAGEVLPGQALDAGYWGRNLREPVLFAAAQQRLIEAGFSVFLEVSPHPVLVSSMQATLRQSGSSGRALPSLQREKPERLSLLGSLGSLYTLGCPVRWEALYPTGRMVTNLPAYPFQRRRYWFEARPVANPQPPLPQQQPVEAGDAEPLAAPLHDWIYTIRWQPAPLRLNGSTEAGQAGAWLILADSQGTGERLAAELASHGERPVLVHPGPAYERLGPNHFSIRPGQGQDYRRLLQEALEEAGPGHAGVVHLWGLDAPPDGQAAPLEQVQESLCVSALLLLQALAEAGRRLPRAPRLWLVTRGAQPATEGLPAPDGTYAVNLALAQSTLWGFGRVAAVEHPEFWGGLVDLDLQPSPQESRLLYEEIHFHDGEGQVAFRGSQRLAPRLERVQNGSNARRTLSIAPDGAYLITGGLGSLGLLVARWLAERGARRLILLSRRGLPPRAEWQAIESASPGSSLAAQIGAVRALEALGASVEVAAVDVAEAEQLQPFLQRFSVNDHPHIAGVVHAAGVLQDKTLLELDADGLNAVLRPKVSGGWLLHQALSGQNGHPAPDFFVNFSSAASLLGSPGQANYAAANAFLDALAHVRRSQGLPALSVNWGPWAEVGLAAQPGRGDRLAQAGMGSIPPEAGLAVLDELLGAGLVQAGVIPADWDTLARHFSLAGTARLLDAVAPQASPTLPVAGRENGDRPAPEVAGLEDYLRQMVAQVLYMQPEEVPLDRHFMELGLDSLMSIELIRSLERDYKIKLYPREIFEQPTIRALAKYLAAEAGRINGNAARESSGPSFTAAQAANLAALAGVQVAAPGGSSTGVQGSPAERNPSMVFLLSAPRSGSTLLRVMLAGHPALFCPPELHLLQFTGMHGRRQALSAAYLDEGLQRAFMELMQTDAASVQALLDEFTGTDMPVQAVYRKLQELAGERLLVDKSPAYAANLETLERAEGLFDRPKYIYLSRHPYAVIESFARNRFQKLLGAGEADPYTLGEGTWATINANILDFLQGVPDERWQHVRYENLVSRPAETARSLCTFLDIPFDEALLHPYQGERMTDGVHAASLGINDPNFLQHDHIEAELGEVWRGVRLPHRLGGFARRVAAELEYELPVEGSLTGRRIIPSPVEAASAAGCSSEEGSPLITIQPEGDKTPIFFMHPASGIVYAYYELARALGKERPFYALQDPSLESEREPHSRIEDYAQEYIDCIRSIQPHGPYLLGGWSFGGHLAVEMANQLASRGEEIAMLLILDTEAPVAGRELTLWQRLRYVKNKTLEHVLGAPDIIPYIKDGLYLLAHANKGDVGQNTPAVSTREWAEWAWADALRRRMIRGAGIAEVFARDPSFKNVRLPNSNVRRGLYILRRHLSIVRSFKPKKYPGKMTFFRAEDQIVRSYFNDETLGWSGLVEGSIEVHHVPGNHVTLFREPHVQVVADRLRRCLEENDV